MQGNFRITMPLGFWHVVGIQQLFTEWKANKWMSVRSVLSNSNCLEYLIYKRDFTDQMEHQQFREKEQLDKVFSRREIKASDIEWGENPTIFSLPTGP